MSLESQHPVLLRKLNPGKSRLTVDSAEVWGHAGNCVSIALSSSFYWMQDCKFEAYAYMCRVKAHVRCGFRYRV